MKKTVSVIVALILLLSITKVQAVDEKNLSFTSNKTEITKGEEIEITISSSQLTGVEGTLNYESKDWSFESKSSENSFTLNEQTGKFVLVNMDGEEKISAKIVLKSKADTTSTSSTISITGDDGENIIGSNTTREGIQISPKTVTIKFKTSTPSATENKIENTPTNNNVTNEYKEITVKSTEKEMPKTGSERVFAVITITAVVSSAMYIGYKKNNY